MFFSRTLVALALISLTAIAVAAPARAMQSMDDGSHGRYLGKPDLALTSAMLAAGGGAAHFSAATLLTMLTAQHHEAELASLTARFGPQRTQRFLVTFDRFVDSAVGTVTAAHIALPPPNPALAHDPYELAASLRQAGVMPDGRFDIGYFVERLLSRPVHVKTMNAVDADPAVGPAANADFHIILTAAMNDVKSLYGLAQ